MRAVGVDVTELLLVVAFLLAVCAAAFVVMRVVAAALRHSVGHLVYPAPPPSLVRLTTVVVRWLEDRQADGRYLVDPPPPELVVAIRAITRRAPWLFGRGSLHGRRYRYR